MQGTTSVFETDQIRPLVTLGEELSGQAYGESRGDRPRAADPRRPHARDVVPDRRRRRAVQRGPRLRAAAPDAARDRAGPPDRDRDAASCRGSRSVVRETMGSAYPELHEQRETIEMWLRNEEEAFNRTLDQGMRLLDDVIARARDGGGGGHRRRPGVPPARHVRLPVRPHARARGRAGAGRRRAGLREPDGRAAHARAQRRPRRAATRSASGSARSRRRAGRRRRSRATSGPSRRRRSARSSADERPRAG